jgi:DNA-binding transcriptional regulator YiaG
MQTKTVTLPEFVAEIGAPFGVILFNSVRQKKRVDNDEVLETSIPNMSGLLKEVAVARALYPRKFSPDEIRFVRKAVNVKASELAKLLGVSAEHLSRCEHGERVLSASAEKLLRVIILKKRFSFSELEKWAAQLSLNGRISEDSVARLKEVISDYRQCMDDVEKAVFDSKIASVHDAGDRLIFGFHLRHSLTSDEETMPDEDEQWRRAA